MQHYHRMLSSVFTKAVQWGIVEDNPVKRAEPPKGEAVEVSYLEEADAARLLAALHDVPLSTVQRYGCSLACSQGCAGARFAACAGLILISMPPPSP